MNNKVAIIKSQDDLLLYVNQTPAVFRIYEIAGRFKEVLISVNDGMFTTLERVGKAEEPKPSKTLTEEQLLSEFNPYIKTSKLVLFNKGNTCNKEVK